MSNEATSLPTVLVEADPLAATSAEIVAAKLKAASMQSDKQYKATMAVTRDWVEQANVLGLNLFERQPEETDKEWFIWCAYRQYYPGRMPTWTQLAKECGSTVSTVVKISQQWNFRLRMVAWSNFTDAGISEKRIAAIKEMNEKQLMQAMLLREKVSEALEYLDPATLKPTEIASLMKLANEQERRIVEAEQEVVRGQVASTHDATAEAKKTDISAVSEILSIMTAAGALGAKILGIEKTTTTTERVVVGEGEHNDE